MSRPKTIFCDIDGTLIEHISPIETAKSDHKITVLHGIAENLEEWDRKGYNIILVTGRREGVRKTTEMQLSQAGIIYDQMIMGLGGGDRILINDKKPNGRSAAWAISQDRDKGISGLSFENLSQIVRDYFDVWSNKDLAALGRMFSEDVCLVDWNISCAGKNQVLKANQAIFENVDNLSVVINKLSHHNNTVFCQITIEIDGEKIPVVDVIEFDKDTKIKTVTAYRGN